MNFEDKNSLCIKFESFNKTNKNTPKTFAEKHSVLSKSVTWRSTSSIKQFKSQLQAQWSDQVTGYRNQRLVPIPVTSSPKQHFQHEQRRKEPWRRFWTPRTPRELHSAIRRATPPPSSWFWGKQRRRSSHPQTDQRRIPAPISDRRRARLREGVAKPRPHSPPEKPVCQKTQSLSGRKLSVL